MPPGASLPNFVGSLFLLFSSSASCFWADSVAFFKASSCSSMAAAVVTGGLACCKVFHCLACLCSLLLPVAVPDPAGLFLLFTSSILFQGEGANKKQLFQAKGTRKSLSMAQTLLRRKVFACVLCVAMYLCLWCSCPSVWYVCVCVSVTVSVCVCVQVCVSCCPSEHACAVCNYPYVTFLCVCVCVCVHVGVTHGVV